MTDNVCCQRITTVQHVEEQPSCGTLSQDVVGESIYKELVLSLDMTDDACQKIPSVEEDAQQPSDGTLQQNEGGGFLHKKPVLTFDSMDISCHQAIPRPEEVEEQSSDGTLYQNQLQSALVDCIETDLSKVFINHASNSVAANGKLGFSECDEDDISLRNGADETRTESTLISARNINHESSYSGLEGRGMDCHNGDGGSLERSHEEASIKKEMLLRSESSSESEDSSDESSSSLESEADEDQADEPKMIEESGDYEEGELKEPPVRERKKKQKTVLPDDVSSEEERSKEPIRSKNELKEFPPVPPVSVILEPHHKTVPAGVISSVVGLYVVVEGIEGQQPLNEGSILWLTEQRLPLGTLDELFGPVKRPFYIVRFNAASEVPQGLKEGVHVSFVPEFAEFVLNDPNMNKRGYDASGENDEEISEEEICFSDDEKEAEYKRSKARMKRGNPEKCIQDNDKWFQGSRNLDKRRQGRQPSNVYNRHQMERGRNKIPHSHHESGLAHIPPRDHHAQLPFHHGQRLSRIQAGPEPVQAIPTSVQHADQPSIYQSPIDQQANLHQISSPRQPQVLGQANQLSHRFGMPSSNQKPCLPKVEIVQAMPTSLPYSEQAPVHQCPIYPQAHLQQFPQIQGPGQAIQVAPGIPLSHQPILHTASTSSFYTGMQASAVGSPVLGIPAGPVNAPFNYSPQLAYSQSFVPSGLALPAVNQYRGNITFQGPPSSAWGLPDQMRQAEPNMGNPAFPLQQRPPQQNRQFFDPRMGSHQGQRFS